MSPAQTSKARRARRSGRAYLYLPIADEQVAGMQRFGSEMIRAILAADPSCRAVIGQVNGSPAWLDEIPHRVIFDSRTKRLLPGPLLMLLRLLWLQFVLPLSAGGCATLVGLAHEIAPFPLMRQIAVAHDLTQLRSYAQRQGLLERLRQRLWIFGLRRSAQVVAISNATRQDLVGTVGLDEARIPVISEGFDPAIFRPAVQNPGPARPFLLYAGTLAPNKNLPFLLRAFAAVRERHDAELLLVGKQQPADVAALLGQVPDHARADVQFRGFVRDEELAALMQRCAAFVFPSLNEGFGLAPVEAMACGAPVISSTAGSLTEVVGSGGLLLDPNDDDAWAAAMGRVLSDEGLRRDLAERALRRSRDFSWAKAASAYCEVINGERLAGPEPAVRA